MNFFNMGPAELMTILIIAILMIGPKRMVAFGRTLSRLSARLRTLSGEFMTLINSEVAAIEEETGENSLESLVKPLSGIASELQNVGRETRAALPHLLTKAASSGQEVAASMADVQAELKATEEQTRQALKEIAEQEKA